jgi:Zn-dependent peptidase ImmA (M78 family)/DNA-binding XRE family transcriptional regulator
MANNNLSMRLQNARKAAAMSTRTVAQRLERSGRSISHATIANYERGKTLPPLDVVAALADLYGLPVNWFLQPQSVMTNVCYRALKKVGVKEKRKFEADAQRWLEGYRRLEIELGEPLRNKLPNFRIGGNESSKLVARRLRSKLNLEERPIPSVIEILHSFGLRVISISTSAAIDGLAAKVEEESVVVLNSRLSNDRVRLNAAHELGHHLYDNTRCLQTLSDAQREKVAFEFASYFLMPSTKLEVAFDGYSMLRLIEYKKMYGISLAAMIYRARKQKLLSVKMYRMLWREFSKRGWRKTEPGNVAVDRPLRFEQMLESAVRSGRLTWAKVAKVTGIHEEDLRQRLSEAVGVWEHNVESAAGSSFS